jgi:hypothetical protein
VITSLSRGGLPPRERALLERYLREAEPILRDARGGEDPWSWPPPGTARSKALLREQPERAVGALVAALEVKAWIYSGLAEELLRQRLPFSSDDAALLVALAESPRESWTFNARTCPRAALAALEHRARAGDDVTLLAERLLVEVAKPHEVEAGEWTKLAVRLRKLLGSHEETLDLSVLEATDPWSESARPVLLERFSDQGELLAQFATAAQSKPSKRWLATTETLVAGKGAELVRFLLTSAVTAPSREDNRFVYEGHEYVSYLWLTDMSATVLRGALWAAGVLGEEAWVAPACEQLLARARQVEQVKIGNAAIFCLGERGDDDAVAALARVVAQIKDRRFLKPAERALERAAEKRGLTFEQLREQLVPTFDLDNEGRGARAIGPGSGLIELVQPANVKVRYRLRENETASAPQELTDSHAEELAAFKRDVAEIRKELAVQRIRLENLLAAGRSWEVVDWREHYLEHPLLQLFTRRLIWCFGEATGIPTERDSLLTLDGPVELPEHGEVHLWHPLNANADEIVAWRTLLRERELRQPFKQAYREIYLLAPAEQETRFYSNRFAAHIVRYPQVYALAKQRGWGIRALGWFDNGGGEQWRDFPDHELRASFWMEMADTEPGGGAIADLAATDQVRFTRIDGRDPVPLEDVPAFVFSEAMRDVDLFVGVASIAADPTWIDGGINRFNAYWREHAFGDLTESGKLRRELLAELLPGLKISDRLELDERYLRVRGNLHNYRIHLGSANILIEPHDRYLCIVPMRRPSLGKLFLPFEDERLAVILSKAMLLAADDKITDPSITHQLR